MTQWLDDPRLLEDIQRKIAKKLQHLDAPPRRTLRLRAQRAELATDQAQWHRQDAPPMAHENTAAAYRDALDGVLQRAGFVLDGSQRYSLAEADERLRRRFGDDVALRMGGKQRLAALQLLTEGNTRASTPVGEHVLHKLVERAGLTNEDDVKDEKPQPQASRTLRAAADRRRGVLLTDQWGQPLRLRSIPD